MATAKGQKASQFTEVEGFFLVHGDSRVQRNQCKTVWKIAQHMVSNAWIRKGVCKVVPPNQQACLIQQPLKILNSTSRFRVELWITKVWDVSVLLVWDSILQACCGQHMAQLQTWTH